MNINITTDELALLAYLHETATGFDDSDVLRHDELQEMKISLNLTDSKFRKSATYLKGFGLVRLNQATIEGVPADILAIGISTFGENFIRQLVAELEMKEPRKFTKFGSRVVKASGAIVTPVAVKVLTDFVTSHAGELARIVAGLVHH